MDARAITTAQGMVFRSDIDTIRESLLEAVTVLAGTPHAFVMKAKGETMKIVRSTLPSLNGCEVPDDAIPGSTEPVVLDELLERSGWSDVPAVADGRIGTVLGQRFSIAGSSYVVFAAAGPTHALEEAVIERFHHVMPIARHTIRRLRDDEARRREASEHDGRVQNLRDELMKAMKASDQLEGVNAQLSNSLLEVSNAKAQSKAMLVTMGLAILLFGVSEFAIEPRLEQSGVSQTVLVYQKVFILGGLVPIEVLVERFISRRLASNASHVRIDMYTEVLELMLEDGVISEKELKWLEVYRRQQGITKDESAAVEARIRADMLLAVRQKDQTNAPAPLAA